MNTWRRLGLAGFAVTVLAFSGQSADARCIDPMDNSVDNPDHCLFRDGGATDNCRVGASIDWDGAGGLPSDPKKMECTDGDPCDGDGAVNGSCTFRVGACVNLPVGGCAASTVNTFTVDKPTAKDANNAIKDPNAVYNRRSLLDAIDAIVPSAGEACTDADLPVKINLTSKGGFCDSTGDKCVTDLDCLPDNGDHYCMPTLKKAKANVGFTVIDADNAKAKSKFKFTCLPKVGALTTGAEAKVISNPADLIGGPLAMGRTGDFLIRNGRVRAVVRKEGRQHSFMLLNGGQIIDADLVRANPADDRDGWLGMNPLVHISSSQGTDEVHVENNGLDGKAAVIEGSGPDELFDTIKGDILVLSSAPLSVPETAIDHDLPIDLTTGFYLTPYSNSIQVATKVTNQSGSPLAYFMGDFVNPGGQLEPFGPGQGYGETQLRNGGTSASKGQTLDYLAFQGGLDSAGVTYGLIFPPTPSAASRATRNTGVFSSSGVYAWTTNVDLFGSLFALPKDKASWPGGFNVAANGSNTLRRWFVVGTTVADVTQARTELYQQDKSVLQGIITVGGVPSAGAHVTLLNSLRNFPHIPPAADPCPSGDNCTNVFSSTLTDDHGFYRFVVPPGNYRIAARKSGAPYEGDGSAPIETPVELKKKKTVEKNIALPGTGTVTVNVVDQAASPIAAKVSIVGVPESPDPLNVEPVNATALATFAGRYFGFNFEEKGDVFGLVDARFSDISGTTGSFNLEPGEYHVVVSHGYEYDVYDEVITVTAGGSNTVNAIVNKVVDTTGFVSIDTHVHMINSPDSAVSRERRVVSMIAEGVDFFVNTDHDFVHDLTDDIADMGATGLVANAPSIESTTSHYGHFNTWPITVDAGQLDGGAIDWSSHNNIGVGYPAGGFYDSTPGEIFADGHAYPGDQVIQVNHFNSGTLGHFNMLGIDTELVSPASSNQVYRCVGGNYPGYPCQIKICLGGSNDGNSCTTDVNCPGGGTCNIPDGPRACPGIPAGVCTLGGNLASYLRLPPAQTNLYDDGYTALEVWIEAGRAQTASLLGDNMGDWFNLLNRGHYKAGVADSDTHSSISVQAGGPRTFVASSTDSPASISASELATNVNALRAVGSNGPFMRVELVGDLGATASAAVGDPLTVPATLGSGTINVHIEAPTWIEYDTIDVYRNSVPSCKSAFNFFGVVNPSSCDTVTPTATLTKGVDFTAPTNAGVSGSGLRQVTDVAIPVAGIGADTWIVVVVRGTDGVSRPLFPMQPQDLKTTGNTTLAALTDSGVPPPWNLGDEGALALAYSNPLFFDFENDGFCHGGTACP